MPVKPLFDLATAACVKNLKVLESIGDFLPYEAVRHILLKIESAPQLRQIELNSPQIKGQTGEIWLRLIEKDFPLEYKSKAYKPQNPDHWYRVWDKYKRDHDTAIQESEAKLKNALAGLRQDKENNTSRIIERKRLPRSLRLAGGKRLYAGGQRDAHSNSLAFNGGSRTRTNTGASVMRKVRREVREMASIHGALSRSIRLPTRQSPLQKAPAAMVDDHRRASQPRYTSTVLSPEPPSAVAEHEARATFISDSEENDADDLFDEEMPTAPSKLARRPVTHPSPTASSPSKKGSGGLLSNKFRGAVGKVAVKQSPSGPAAAAAAAPAPPSRSAAAKPSQHLARTQTSPPPAAAATVGPSPPPAAESTPALPSSSECVPRKRKAVDIFMRRPTKRTT
ncbi:hypothetical protein E4U41_002805 [Claviceps citrina]|nr:hypothetical protein E4U41_002805 [Claviceps citrina]